MSNLSRRSLVAGAASLPALAAGTAVASEAEPLAGARMIGDTSRAACIARAKHIVALLDDCYIREGWHESFDRERAAQLLENVRTFDEHDGDDPRFTDILEWTRDHGQSLDWLFQGDVRGMIAGQAKNSAAASQLAAEPDPIFAAIEAHRQADQEFTARNAYANKLESEWFKQRSSPADRNEAVDAARKVEARASEKTDEVACILASVEPTTIAGVYALLAYFADVEVVDGGVFWPSDLQDDDDPAVVKSGGASTAYFIARSVCRALAKIAQGVTPGAGPATARPAAAPRY